MDIEKLIEKLRTESLYKDKATLEIMDLCMEAADKLERINDFDKSQSAKLLAENGKLRAELDVMREITEFPAADVAPVRHGHWITGFENFSPYQKCSTCGLEIPLKATEGDMEICLYRFCPNCGARMDREEEV